MRNVDKIDDFLENYYEKCGPVAKAVKNIGVFLIVVLSIVCLVSYISDGMSFGSIIGSMLVLWIICGLVVMAATIIVEVIVRAMKK